MCSVASIVVPLAVSGGLYMASVAIDRFATIPADGSREGWLCGMRVRLAQLRDYPERNPLDGGVAAILSSCWLAYPVVSLLKWKFTCLSASTTAQSVVLFFGACVILSAVRKFLTIILTEPLSEWVDTRFCPNQR